MNESSESLQIIIEEKKRLIESLKELRSNWEQQKILIDEQLRKIAFAKGKLAN